MRSRRQLWVAPSHPLAQQQAVSLKDIAAHPYILITVDEGEQSTMRYWHKKRIEPNIAFRTSSMEALRGLVAHGFGVTVLSDMVFRPWSLEGKRIEARPVNDAIPHMEAGMIWRKGATLERPVDRRAAVPDSRVRRLMQSRCALSERCFRAIVRACAVPSIRWTASRAASRPR